MPGPRRVLIIDSETLTHSMLAEWLEADGWQVLEPRPDDAPAPVSLVVLDLPFPRAGALDPLRAVRREYPGVPVIVISPTLFGNVGCCGPCADVLDVGGVLPKPVSRDALLAAVRRLVDALGARSARSSGSDHSARSTR